jgi:hypothetical protein
MKKADGTIAHCDAKGWGLVPVIMEQSNLNDCREYYRHNGYTEE